MERLIQEVLALSDSEKQQIIVAIRKDARERRLQEAVELCKGYVEIANEIVGMDVRIKGRETARKWGKAMIVWQMYLDGFVQRETGVALGIDHSLACDYKRIFTHAMSHPEFYDFECRTWKEFKERLLCQKKMVTRT